MISRYLAFLFLLYSFSFAGNYPAVYSQLANPLYNSSKELLKLSDIKNLSNVCVSYSKEVDELLLYVKTVDLKDKKELQSYLQKLRKLQMKYDLTLYKINEQINRSIDNNEYKTFLRLTNCNLEGVLKGKALLEKAIRYYEKNKSNGTSECLDAKREFIKLLQISEEEIYNQSVQDSFSSSQQNSTSKKVYLTADDLGEYILISIYNNNEYTITIGISAEYKGFSYNAVDKEVVIGSKSKLEYIKLFKKFSTYSYNIRYKWIIGSKDAVHDKAYLYRLPYKKNTSIVVSQGFDGRHSHFGRNKYAIDFAMSEGSVVYAAREGKVVETKSDSNIGGLGKKYSWHGNYIKVEHKDGTLAIYYHLQQHGVFVKVGEMVQRGQKIGKSGNTGNSSGPHLHFSVFKANSSKSTQTLPIRFITTRGIVDKPKKGMAYKVK